MPIFNHGLPIKANVIQGEGGTDTSQDTVTPETLVKGETAHDASGAQITGTLDTEAIRAEGVEAGKEDEARRRWDAVVNRKDSFSLFSGRSWNNDTLIPFSDVVVNGNASFMFAYSEISGSLKEHFQKRGYDIRFENLTSCQQMFYYSIIERIPELRIDTSWISTTFAWCDVKVIDKFVLLRNNTSFKAVFNCCRYLEELLIEGTIAENGFDVSWSPLNKASLTSVVNALSDTTTGLTVTLRHSAIKKAFETSEGANDGTESSEWQNLVFSKPNWNIVAIDKEAT